MVTVQTCEHKFLVMAYSQLQSLVIPLTDFIQVVTRELVSAVKPNSEHDYPRGRTASADLSIRHCGREAAPVMLATTLNRSFVVIFVIDGLRRLAIRVSLCSIVEYRAGVRVDF